MKKNTNWLLIAFLINLALLPLALAAAEKATATRSSGVFFACCRDSSAGDSYCCDRCCIFTWDCLRHDMCGDR